MKMNNEQKLISDYRKNKRKRIKSLIDELNKANQDMFKLWCYEKSLDDKILRRQARENLIRIEELSNMYDAAASELPPATRECPLQEVKE